MNAYSNAFYRMALISAKNCNMSGAIGYASYALYLDKQNNNARKLLGLCLYEAGELSGAAAVLVRTEWETAASGVLSETNEAFMRVLDLVRRRKWRKALRELDDCRPNARIWNIRGCIYMCAGKLADARTCFCNALCMDTGNRRTAGYLKELAAHPSRRSIFSIGGNGYGQLL